MSRKVAFVLALGVTVGMTAAFAVQFPDRGPKPDIDVRLADDGPRAPLRMPTLDQRSAAESLARRLPGLSLRWDGMSGSPKWLAAPPGELLSRPRGGSPETAARAFLRSSSELLGLTPAELASLELTSTVSAPDGGAHLYFTQRVAGLEVYGGRLNVTISADGAVRWLGSRLYGGVEAPRASTIDPAAAVSIAAHDAYPDIIFEGRLSKAADDADPERATSFTQDEFGRDPRVRLVLFPGKSETRLAWEVRVGELTLATEYLTIVDAVNGGILARRNLTSYASARVLNATHPDPEYGEFVQAKHVVVGIPSSTPESPQGWLGGDDTTLAGNNASSHLGWEFQPGLTSPTGDYDYVFNTNEAVLTNAWYWANEAHDRFYAAGFDEAAGNFQDDNFGNGGIGGDRVRVVARVSDNWGTYWSGTVDGESPILSVNWLSDCPFCSDQDGYPENGGDRSRGFNRALLFHEYGHGVTGRRVGGPADLTCLSGIHGAWLREGWSDSFAASFFDDPTVGEFETFGNGFVTDLRHDLGLADLGLESMYSAALWGGPMWDLRESMAALDPTTGIDDFHRLIVESLASAPCDPTVLDARDAILAADTLLFASVHHEAIWNVFAPRGMGENASAIDENDFDPVEDYTVPAAFVCSVPALPTGLIASVTGDNEITLDYDASGATSVEIWRDDLDNPADAAERIAFTTDLSQYVDATVQGGKSYRYHVVALGAAGILCRSAESGASDVTATGTCTAEFPLFVPNLTVTDAGSSSCELILTWDPASQACPGSSEPIVYNIYRSNRAAFGTNSPGFLPSDLLLIGRTASTTFTDAPPEINEALFNNPFNNASHYLVLAQHGTLTDSSDHRDRGSSQVLQWRAGIPTLGRTTVEFWDFDSGDQGWTIDDNGDPGSPFRWALVDPIPTYYGGELHAPDEPAGGTGMAWVTGDPGVPPDSIAANATGNQGEVIVSPTWDATDGATIVSFDYWARPWEPGRLANAFAICAGDLDPCTRDVGMVTTQRFNGPGRYGWQRFEIDLSTLVTPSENQGVQFANWRPSILAEFGIDNVRIERATVCSRSQLDLVNVVVDDSEPGWGNGDGYLQPGEIGRLSVEIGNNGSTTAVAPAGAILSPAPGVSILDPDASFPDIAPAGTAVNSDDGFVVAVPETPACSSSVTFELIFTAASGERTTSLWTLEYGTQQIDTLLTDDFQTDQGWLSTGAGIGQGVWQRGKPLLTMDGANVANPFEDSPNDANAFCYVTENTITGDPLVADVDPGADPVLTSPPLTVDGYKRVTFDYDLWAYCDDGCTDRAFWFETRLDDDTVIEAEFHDFFPRSVWVPHTLLLPLDPGSSLGSDIRLAFSVFDYVNDDILEAGVDNVLIQGERRVCDPTGINAPNSVGDTLRLGKSAAADLQWIAPPVDGAHDAAVFYKVWVSAAPDGGFLAKETPTSPDADRPLAGVDEYYLISAHNGGGSSN